jgi:hypothetical protein
MMVLYLNFSGDYINLNFNKLTQRYTQKLLIKISECKTVTERISDQQEQDSNPGGWRKGRFIMLVGQHPGTLQKWNLPHSSRLQGFYASECRSKQVRRTKANVTTLEKNLEAT